MTAASVALCMIVKDGVEHLERCLASVRPYVAEVNVYDTGSTDGTLDLLARLAAGPGAPVRVERGEWGDDFGWARARSYAMASPEHGWLMFLDDDEELVGGGRLAALVADLEGRGDDAARVVVEIAADRNTLQVRMMRRGSGFWEGAVDEYWRLRDGYTGALANPGLVRVAHLDHSHYTGADGLPDGGTSYYLPFVERAAADGAATPRAAYQLAVEAVKAGDANGLVRHGVAYLTDPVIAAAEPEWNPRRVNICRLAAVACLSAGRLDDAEALIDLLERYQSLWLEASAVGVAPPPPWGAAAAWIRQLVETGADWKDTRLVIDPPDLPVHAGAPDLRALLNAKRGEARPRVQRNALCSCGSGVKAKRCACTR